MLHGHKSLYVSTIHSDWFLYQVVIFLYLYKPLMLRLWVSLFSFHMMRLQMTQKINRRGIQAITPSIHSQIFCPLTFVFLRSCETSFIPTKGGWSLVFRLRVSLPSYQIKHVRITSLKPTIATDSLELAFTEALGILRFDTGSNATLKRRRRSRRLYYNISQRYSTTRNVIKIIPEAAK